MMQTQIRKQFLSTQVSNKCSAPRTSIICMAHPRRVVKVAKQIEREIGKLLLYDKIMQEAICPERKRGLDGAVSALASVTEVELTNDLQVAKVFLSIYSDDLGKETAIRSLKGLEGYARKHIARTIRLRLTPEIRFIMDESIERSERVMKLLEQVKRIQAGEEEPPPIALFDDDDDDDYKDEEEEGADEVVLEDFSVRGGSSPRPYKAADLGFFGDDTTKSATGRRKGAYPSKKRENNKGKAAPGGKKQERDDDDDDDEEEVSEAELAELLAMFKKYDSQ